VRLAGQEKRAVTARLSALCPHQAPLVRGAPLRWMKQRGPMPAATVQTAQRCPDETLLHAFLQGPPRLASKRPIAEDLIRRNRDNEAIGRSEELCAARVVVTRGHQLRELG